MVNAVIEMGLARDTRDGTKRVKQRFYLFFELSFEEDLQRDATHKASFIMFV